MRFLIIQYLKKVDKEPNRISIIDESTLAASFVYNYLSELLINLIQDKRTKMMELEDNQPVGVNLGKVDLLAALSQVFDTLNPTADTIGQAGDMPQITLLNNPAVQEKSFEYLAQIKDKFKEQVSRKAPQ